MDVNTVQTHKPEQGNGIAPSPRFHEETPHQEYEEKILIVDDDEAVLDSCRRAFFGEFKIDTANNGQSALERLDQNGPYAVVVVDMQMPGMNGIELLAEIRKKEPDTVRMMLTGNADQQTAVRAVNEGHIYQFLNKPCPVDVFAVAFKAGIHHYRMLMAEHHLLEKTLGGSIRLLTEILAIVQPRSFGRAVKLREYARTFAEHCGIRRSWEIQLAAMLSQLGHVTIPSYVTDKLHAGRFVSPKEKEVVAGLPSVTSNMLRKIPRLEHVAQIVLYQQKHFDGKGFPNDGISGKEIPIGSKILKALSDLIDLESHGSSKNEAFEHMRSRQGWYDPEILRQLSTWEHKFFKNGHASRLIRVSDLKPGLTLLSDIKAKDGKVIVSKGFRLTSTHIEQIRHFHSLEDVQEPFEICE